MYFYFLRFVFIEVGMNTVPRSNRSWPYCLAATFKTISLSIQL